MLNSGGLILDNGWVRVFAGGSGTGGHDLPSLAQVNRFPTAFDPAWYPRTGLVLDGFQGGNHGRFGSGDLPKPRGPGR